MTEVIESGVGAVNYIPQLTKGATQVVTLTTVGTNKPKAADGTMLKANKRKDSEEYVDGLRWGSPSQYTTGVGGEVGPVVIQAQPENAQLFLGRLLGSDVVTGGSDPYTHTSTSNGGPQPYGAWYQSVGSTIGPVKQKFSDSKIGKLTLECGQDQYTMHETLDIFALNAGEAYTTVPSKTEDASDPYIWSECDGQVSFDATTLGDVNGEVLELDTGMEPYYGNAIVPSQLIEKKGSIVRTIKTIFTDQTILKFYKALYNTTTPSAGDKPVKDVFYAAIVNSYVRSATRTLTLTTPRVAIDSSDIAIGPKSEGGEIAVEFGGQCLKSGGTAALTAVSLVADATAWV